MTVALFRPGLYNFKQNHVDGIAGLGVVSYSLQTGDEINTQSWVFRAASPDSPHAAVPSVAIGSLIGYSDWTDGA